MTSGWPDHRCHDKDVGDFKGVLSLAWFGLLKMQSYEVEICLLVQRFIQVEICSHRALGTTFLDAVSLFEVELCSDRCS